VKKIGIYLQKEYRFVGRLLSFARLSFWSEHEDGTVLVIRELRVRSVVTRTELTLETSVYSPFNNLTQLLAEEYFIETESNFLSNCLPKSEKTLFYFECSQALPLSLPRKSNFKMKVCIDYW
jgi:hypothetical protein